MKRFLIVLLFVILFTLSFAACGEGVKMQNTGENGQTVVDNNDKDKTDDNGDEDIVDVKTVENELPLVPFS